MTEEELIQILKAGKSVAPRRELRERFLQSLEATPQKRATLREIIWREFAENLKFGAALGLATFLLFIAFGSVTWWSDFVRTPGGSGLSERELLTEAAKLDFEIQLGEAQYYTDSAREIAVILDEIDDPSRTMNTVDGALEEIF
jgi:hypothetical protein